jgi:hypothetical protein
MKNNINNIVQEYLALIELVKATLATPLSSLVKQNHENQDFHPYDHG